MKSRPRCASPATRIAAATLPSAHLPHGWDAGVLFDETHQTLSCSDLFHHVGDTPAVTDKDIVGNVKESMQMLQSGPLSAYLRYTSHTEPLLRDLAKLQPKTLAIMHGSSYAGDRAKALEDLAGLMREVFEIT